MSYDESDDMGIEQLTKELISQSAIVFDLQEQTRLLNDDYRRSDCNLSNARLKLQRLRVNLNQALEKISPTTK